MTIAKIVSGGQTGADQGALEAALYCSLPHGGWVPAGRKTEKGGRVPERFDRMREMKSGDYAARTEANVVDSDATLVFTFGKPSGGSLKTLDLAHAHGKPRLHINLRQTGRKAAVWQVKRWFDGPSGAEAPPAECVLNVAGSRESTAPGIQPSVMILMIDIINAVNGFCAYPPSAAPPEMLRSR